MNKPLTWQQVVGPNFAGVQDSINSAARLFSNAANGASGAVGQFADQGVLAKLAGYSDAGQLQTDIASGAMPVGNASAEALAKVMSRSSNLIENASNQQNMDYRSQLNPLLIAGKTAENNQAALMDPLLVAAKTREIAQNEAMDPLRVAALTGSNAGQLLVNTGQGVKNRQDEVNLNQDNALFDRLKSFGWGKENRLNNEAIQDRGLLERDRNRTEDQYQNNQTLMGDLARLQSSGGLATEAQANAILGEAVTNKKPIGYIANLTTALKGLFPSINTPAETLLAGGGGGSVSSSKGMTPAISKVASAAAEKYGIPSEYMTGMLNMEGGLKGAISPTGATGPGQFTQKTWNNLANSAEGKSLGMLPVDASNFQKDNDPRKNADVNIMASALLAKENSGYIKEAGLPVTPQNLYLVHNVGPGILTALKGGKPSAETLDAMKKNGFKDGDTVQSWSERHIGKFNAGMPSSAELALSASSGSTANTLAKASSGASEVMNLVKIAKSSYGTDTSTATITNNLTGKDGPFSKTQPAEIETQLNYVKEQLGVNGAVAAEVLKEAGTNTDRKLNIFGEGPMGWQKSINESRLKTLVQDYKKNGKLLNAERTSSIYAQNEQAINDAQSATKQADALVAAAAGAVRKGTPGAEEMYKQALIDQADSRITEQSVSQATANIAQPGMRTDPVPERPAVTGASTEAKAASLLKKADKSVAPVRTTDGGKTWQLELPPTIRDPNVPFYRVIPNPAFQRIGKQSFKSLAEAEKAFLDMNP
jgi:hypothetical protein